MNRITQAALAAVLGTLALPALASPFTDAEAQLRAVYGDYRAALFLSNAGKAPETAKALAGFDTAWSEMSAQWGTTPPPQYAADAALPQTFDAVSALIGKARDEVAAGKLPAAHETLEGVRAEIAGLHERAGLIGFSERMNAYHAAMEEVLGRDYAAMGPGAAAALAGDAAVLDYLAAQIVANPAPEAENPAYAPLVDAFAASARAFRAAADSGDVAGALAARGALKVPYSKLFAQFG